VRHWEIIADNLSKAGWSWGCLSAVDRDGRTIWIVDAHRDDGKRFVVHADEKLTAFLQLESAIRQDLKSGAKVQTASNETSNEPDRQASASHHAPNDGYRGQRKMLMVIATAITAPNATAAGVLMLLPFFEPALVLVRSDHIASIIVNSDQGIM
jgi:hypothetical protein